MASISPTNEVITLNLDKTMSGQNNKQAKIEFSNAINKLRSTGISPPRVIEGAEGSAEPESLDINLKSTFDGRSPINKKISIPLNRRADSVTAS